ncbi:PREDICTED: P-selectin glycoprotein ligand 1 [Gekko japonicus]|uniref:P-selectin glycoprotein ligand 1 n=1 Tax=Gekko japonicus TaxID=146911 RepID=A0ABM1K4V8_GEKJA|nr:PREDICTED: P-selectin glycoprotein ligand 1 [Gekko japonicus]
MAGEASHDSTPLPRRKRDVVPSTESSLKAITLLDDETDRPSVEPTTELLDENVTSQTGLAGNSSSAKATATSRSLAETSTEAAVVRLSTVRDKGPLRGQMTTTTGLSEDFTETEGAEGGRRPSHATDTTRPRASTAPSQAFVATSATPVATSGPASKSGVKAVGGANSSLSPPTASSKPSSTARARPPTREAPPGPDKMVGQCLLAISLLALVAAIFIIATFVLIALLLRQKRAYKLHRHNHTEMVCISSLLAAEEAEASGGRAPRAKRVKTLAENGSETDMDNLTLNSFLPDH